MRFQFQSSKSHTQTERVGKLEISRFPMGFEFGGAFSLGGEVWGPLLGF